MITIAVTPQGFQRDRLAVIIEKLTAKAKLIFGDDINLAPATQDGQLIGTFAEAIDDCGQALEAVYNGRNPGAASGQNLRSICLLNGVYWQAGSYASVDVQAVVTFGATVPTGTQVQDEDTGAVYEFQTDVVGTTPTQGVFTVTCLALEKGSVSAAGKVTKIVTPTYGLVSVTNAQASSSSTAEESEEQLRIRRTNATATPTQAIVDGVRAGLVNVPGVLKLRLWENVLDTQANAKGTDQALPPHSLTAVVVGGSASAIGAALFTRKSLGCSTNGTTTVQVSDSQGNAQSVKYTVATEVPLYVYLSYTERVGQGFGADGGEAAITQALVDYVNAYQQPGEDVFRSHLQPAALAAVPGIDGRPAFAIQSLTLGRSVETLANSDLALAFNEYATLTAANVTLVKL